MDFLRHLLLYFDPNFAGNIRPPDTQYTSPNARSTTQTTTTGVFLHTHDGQVVPIDLPYNQALQMVQTRKFYDATHTVTPPHKIPGSLPVPSQINSLPLPSRTRGSLNSTGTVQEWDGWPDGEMSLSFTHREFTSLGNLCMHWASRTNGTRKGYTFSETWQGGRQSERVCLGIITCDQPHCPVIVRPKTSPGAIHEQLSKQCICGGIFEYQGCTVKSILYTWKDGVHFINLDYHLHPRPTHILHLMPNERHRFEQLVLNHPNVGPLGLVAGIPGLRGTGESAADISKVLVNADRVSRERSVVKKGKGLGHGGEAFIDGFALFEQSHSNFIVNSQFGEVTVVSLQSPAMRKQLVNLADDSLENPEYPGLHGTVSDAAHGWWKIRRYLLIVTSVYCPAISAWAPALFSYSNGSSAQHYRLHFLALFQGLAHEITERAREPLLDNHFIGMMDFSEAERNGFILAFMDLWLQRGDTRSPAELQAAAGNVLRGCEEHFRAGVTRICRNMSLIPLDRAMEFKRRAMALVSLPSTAEFLIECRKLVVDFPSIASWLDWWMREVHASMLFVSQRKMEPHIWEAIPKTNNAEEAMHWKLYCMVGRDHASIVDGLYALVKVDKYYQRLVEAASSGALIRYGVAKPWQANIEKIGRSKLSRDPLAPKKPNKNDGRPPDTTKAIKKANKKNTSKKVQLKIDSMIQKAGINTAWYTWNSNSCWLDTSLVLLITALQPHKIDLENAVNNLPSLSQLKEAHTIAFKPSTTSPDLDAQRDLLRQKLFSWKCITGINSPQSLWGWLSNIVLGRVDKSIASGGSNYRGYAFFDSLLVTISSCTGSLEIGGKHVVLSSHRAVEHELDWSLYVKWNGKVQMWLEHGLLSTTRTWVPHPHGCWRVHDGKRLCSGARQDMSKLVISIPIILLLNVTNQSAHAVDNLDSESPLVWDFPSELYPSADPLSGTTGLVYDLVGFGVISGGDTSDRTVAHFTCVYSDGLGGHWYSYNDMAGSASRYDVKDNTKLCGTSFSSNLDHGSRVHSAVYCLRGGTEAQVIFFEERIKHLQKQFGICVSDTQLEGLPTIQYAVPGLVHMPRKDRSWMSNPEGRSEDEYVSPSGKYDMSGSGSRRYPIKFDDGPESEDGEELDDSGSRHEPDKVQLEVSMPPSKKQKHQTSLKSLAVTAVPESEDASKNPESMKCRCLCHGPLTNVNNPIVDGDIIQCILCESWSHIACQRNGRACERGSQRITQFICDYCSLEGIPGFPSVRESTRTRQKRLTSHNLPLKDRLRPGLGALAPVGEFYYPVRLIKFTGKEWTVKWWRGNQYLSNDAPNNVPAFKKNTVPVEQIRDALWGEATARREIRLGKWCHANEVESVEEMLSNPYSCPYTPDIHLRLVQHTQELQHLLTHPDAFKTSHVPVSKYLEWQNGRTHGLVSFSGGLTFEQRAKITNWFKVNVSNKLGVPDKDWLALPILAHTMTLFLASGITGGEGSTSEELSGIDLDWQNKLDRAWEMQCTAHPDEIWEHVDVDKECLSRLEELMFENSIRAGLAGNHQWGLNKGDHQDAWDPYKNLPEAWNVGDREGSDSEVMVIGYNYVKISKPPLEIIPNSRPKSQRKPKKLERKRKIVDLDSELKG